MYYKGLYHLFYQYNPGGAVWGNLTWGHAVSKNLIHWLDLEPALLPDCSYDVGGVWSGSVTFRPDGTPVILYTGSHFWLLFCYCRVLFLSEIIKRKTTPMLPPA